MAFTVRLTTPLYILKSEKPNAEDAFAKAQEWYWREADPVVPAEITIETPSGKALRRLSDFRDVFKEDAARAHRT